MILNYNNVLVHDSTKITFTQKKQEKEVSCATQSAYIHYYFLFVCLIFLSIYKSINQNGMYFVNICDSINTTNLTKKVTRLKVISSA